MPVGRVKRMSRLKGMVPPGEAIRWAAFANDWAMEIVVTDRNVIWAGGGYFDREQGKAPLAAIRFVDLEEGDNSVNLHCNGAVHRIEEITPGKLEELASAIGRPARIWRECTSPAAKRSWRRARYLAATVAGLAAMTPFGFAYMLWGTGVGGRFFTMLGLAAVSGLLSSYIGDIARQILPHLLVGCLLSGEVRRDFLGLMTDPRWQGVKPDGPDDGRSPRSRLGDWAMRRAYGEIPDLGEREPEILIRGEFPPTAEAD